MLSYRFISKYKIKIILLVIFFLIFKNVFLIIEKKCNFCEILNRKLINVIFYRVFNYKFCNNIKRIKKKYYSKNQKKAY